VFYREAFWRLVIGNMKMVRVVVCLVLMLACTGCDRASNRVFHGSGLAVQTFSHIESVQFQNMRVVIQAAPQAIRFHHYASFVEPQMVAYLGAKFSQEINKDIATALSGDEERFIAVIEKEQVTCKVDAAKQRLVNALGMGHSVHCLYDVALRLVHQDASRRELLSTQIKVAKPFSYSEHASPAQKEQIQFNATEDLFVKIDTEVTRFISGHML